MKITLYYAYNRNPVNKVFIKTHKVPNWAIRKTVHEKVQEETRGPLDEVCRRSEQLYKKIRYVLLLHDYLVGNYNKTVLYLLHAMKL